MTDSWQKMVSGEVYDALAPELINELNRVKDLVWRYNQIRPSDYTSKEQAIRALLGKCGVRPIVNQPFYCDYGRNIEVGDFFFSNFNLTILDEAPVKILHRPQCELIHGLPPHQSRRAEQRCGMGAPHHHRQLGLDRR